MQPGAQTGPNAPCSGNTNNWTFYGFSAWQTSVGEETHRAWFRIRGFRNPAYPNDDYTLPKGSPGAETLFPSTTHAGGAVQSAAHATGDSGDVPYQDV